MIAPDAELGDGAFDVTIVHARSKPELLVNFSRLYTGAIAELPFVTTRRAARVDVEIVDEPIHDLLELDGDAAGRTPARFEMLAGALTVRG